MAKIHGLAYLMLGIMISGLSYYIGQTKEGFKIFIYAGLLMIITGVIKLATAWARSRKEETAKQHITQKHITHHQTTHPYSHQRALYCPRCGTALNPTDNFCYNCGNRIINYYRK